MRAARTFSHRLLHGDSSLCSWHKKPQARPRNTRNDGTVNSGENTASRVIGDAGTGIYKASTSQYSENALPGSFGPATGTPEQGIDETFILYAGPRTGH